MDLKARQQYPPDMVPQLPAPPMAFLQQLQQMQAAAQMQATVQQQLQASQPQQQPQMQTQPQPTAPQSQQPQQQPPQMQPLMQPQMPQPGEEVFHILSLRQSGSVLGLLLLAALLLVLHRSRHLCSHAAVWQMLFVPISILHQILLGDVKARSSRPVTLTCRGCLTQTWLEAWLRCQPPPSSTCSPRTHSACRRPQR
jgi:hypothetical protein